MSHSLKEHRHSLSLSLLVAAGFVPFACTSDSTSESPSDGGQAGAAVGFGGADEPGGGGGGPVVEPGAWKFPCTTPQLDPISGLVTCKQGYQHRPSAVTCNATGERQSSGRAGGMGGNGGLARADGTLDCSDDNSVCDSFDLGFCADLGGGGGPQLCHSGCETDSDCGAGQACLCDYESEHGGVCIEAQCATNADCEAGYRCLLEPAPCGPGALVCQRPQDGCYADAECAPERCVFDREDERRVCGSLASCGRPFIVQARARVAPTLARGDWKDAGLLPRVEHLSANEREAAAARWTKLGQLEHASIAAFARFSLQLLALGAPPQLVDDCTRALADETAHARRCFAIASAYANRPVGPGPLDIDGSLTPTALLDVVDLVIVEGCLGETAAALDALRESESADDSVLAATFRQIAKDEQRHAELAFRFLRWAFERDAAAVAERVLAAQQTPAWSDHPAQPIVAPCFDALVARAQFGGVKRLQPTTPGKRVLAGPASVCVAHAQVPALRA